jgi:DNA-binding winged helix-turn-helix (wHTH) protein/predicted ATPase
LAKNIYRFDGYELDRSAYQLRRKGSPVQLERIPLELLFLLADRRGQLVTRGDIFEHVWGNGVFLDTDNAINSAVRKLRHALHDDSNSPRFVATVPAKGYRFLAEVTTGAAHDTAVEVPSIPQGPAPIMVGREAELARLQSWSSQAIGGRRRVVFVVGEAGIGKTTFVRAFLDSLGGSAVRIGRGQCVEQYGAGEPYMPVLEALTRICQEAGGKRVAELLRKLAPAWLAQMPSLLTNADRKRLRGVSQGVTQQRMLREMAQALEALTAETPLVLSLEDLHWSDFSTLELISAIGRRTEPARLLILGTFRPSEMLPNDHPLRTLKQELELHRYCDELQLKLLSEADVAAYLRERFADDDTARSLAGVAPLIHERTEGNPLFMVNVVDYLIVQGSPLVPNKIEAPRSILQMIERNLERLNRNEQRILEAASVVGAEFSAAAVAAALERPVSDIEDSCTQLSRHEQFITAHGVSRWPDGTVASGFRFHHALYYEVLYERLPAGHLVELHRRIAEREEKAHGQRAGEIATELAHHYSRANDRNKAIQYFRVAAERAAVRGAMVEAERHYMNALKLLDELPETPERDRQELALQLAVGPVSMAVKGWAAPEVEHAYTRGLKLSGQLGELAQLFSILYGLWVNHLERLEFRSAYQIAEELLLRAESAGDSTLFLQAHQAFGVTAHRMGRFQIAREHLETMLSLCGARRSRPLGVDMEVVARSQLSWTLWILGYSDQALKMSHGAFEVARVLSDPFSLTFAEIFLCYLLYHRREVRALQKTAERVISICSEQGFAYGLAHASVLRGAAMTELGRGEEGLNQLQQGFAAHRAAGAEANRSEFLYWLAKAYCATGRLDEALDTLNNALGVAEQHENLWWQAEIYRLKGEFLLHRRHSNAAEAQGCFERAITIAQGQSAKSWELRATTSLARLLASQGRRDEGRSMLADIYNWFTEGFDTADLKDAKALLDQLGA